MVEVTYKYLCASKSALLNDVEIITILAFFDDSLICLFMDTYHCIKHDFKLVWV